MPILLAGPVFWRFLTQNGRKMALFLGNAPIEGDPIEPGGQKWGVGRNGGSNWTELDRSGKKIDGRDDFLGLN